MIRENLICLIDETGSTDRKRFSEFAEKTGIGKDTLKQFYHGKQKLNNENLDQILKAFPQYAYWICTGKVAPEIGQGSPISTEKTVGIKDAIVSILESAETTGTLLTPEQTADLILEQLSTRKDDRVEDKDAI